MCLKTISKTEVSAFISCSLLSIHTCSYELYLKFRTQKKEKGPFQPLDVVKISCTRRISYKACSRFTF